MTRNVINVMLGLLVAVAFVLAGCGGANDTNHSNNNNDGPTLTATVMPTPTLTVTPVADSTTATPTPTVTSTELPKVVPVSSDYMIGAYYWISWNTQEVLTPGMDWNDSMFQPLLGKYDSTNTTVIDSHIKWAVEHGISFFAVQFYETQLKEGFLKASLLPYIKFSFIAPDVLSVSADPRSVHQIEWMSTYFDNPQYLKIDGRPVVFVLIEYNENEMTLQEETLLVTRIKDMKSFAQGIGQNPYLVGVYFLIPEGNFDLTSEKINQEFDAITEYSMCAAGGMETSYDSMVSAYIPLTKDWSEGAKAIGTSFIPNVLSGFDDSLSYQHGTRGWLTTRSGSTPEKFQMLCEAIKQYIDPKNKILMITAWNEFTEGSVIEPTEEYEFGYLEVIKRIFANQQ